MASGNTILDDCYRDKISELRKKLSSTISDEHPDEHLLRYLKIGNDDDIGMVCNVVTPSSPVLLRRKERVPIFLRLPEQSKISHISAILFAHGKKSDGTVRNIAANLDVKLAAEFYLINLKRRDFFEFDTITKEYKKTELIEKCEFTSFLGFDKEDSPILYLALVNADFIGIIYTMSTFDVCNYGAYLIETALERQRERQGKHGEEFCGNLTVILDFEDCRIQQFFSRYALETGLDLLQKFQDMHPSILKRVFIINAPFYFAKLFNLFKPIIAFETFQKIMVCSKGMSSSELLKYIDDDVLPVFLGGNRVDENKDPKCSAFLKFGCAYPETAYKIHAPMLQLSDVGVSEMDVPAGSVQDYCIHVDQPGSKLKVEFRGDHTIAFSICFSKSSISSKVNGPRKPDPRDELPLDKFLIALKVHSHISPFCSTFHCSRVGTYICQFDNTSSWRSSKHVIYKIQVLPPSES